MGNAESFGNVECGMANAESTKCGMRNAECGIIPMWNAEWRMRNFSNVECGMRNAEFGMRNGLKSKVQGARDGTAKVAKRAEWE